VEFDALDCDSHPGFYDGLAERPDIVVYTKWLWRYIMIAVRCIPESMFKRLRL